ncbi:hypothetical protein XBJ1_0650 [Xenorhabdus bovienii SS-2004]|uniref:Uncharacterized protein n=1 Tax=Xenorhabdus bovienii (strain SS-2004) TaxID=406818 RepID=D3UZE8_XENBS|nr:hypothetical protein XBJ1_0650 [Xenorhabdus bovienii SS-2004]
MFDLRPMANTAASPTRSIVISVPANNISPLNAKTVAMVKINIAMENPIHCPLLSFVIMLSSAFF